MDQTPESTKAIPPMPPELPPMSLGARLLNVFATPGDVFDRVKAAGPTMLNWLAPALLTILVGWACAWLIFSQDSIRHQLNQITDQAIQKQVEKAHMSEAQAEQMRAVAEKYSGLTQKFMAIVGPVLGAFISPFLMGLLLWLIGTKALKGQFDYMKAVEVVGLSNMIVILHGIIKTLLIVAMGNLFAGPSLVLLVKDFNPQNPAHLLLAAVDVMTFWLLAVRSIGLARLSGASVAKAAAWLFGLWAAYTGFSIGMRAAMQAVFGR